MYTVVIWFKWLGCTALHVAIETKNHSAADLTKKADVNLNSVAAVCDRVFAGNTVLASQIVFIYDGRTD